YLRLLLQRCDYRGGLCVGPTGRFLRLFAYGGRGWAYRVLFVAGCILDVFRRAALGGSWARSLREWARGAWPRGTCTRSAGIASHYAYSPRCFGRGRLVRRRRLFT